MSAAATRDQAQIPDILPETPGVEPEGPSPLTRLLNLGRRMSFKQAFTALQYPNYRLWFRGQMASLFGSWMQSTALGFLIYQLTRSPAQLGLVGFVAGIPTWLFMLYAGVVADRVPRRKMLIVTQSAMMTLAGVLALLTFTHVVRPWHILIIAFGLGTCNAFDAPARQAFVLEMVKPQDLTNAIALNSAMFNIAVALGPAAGGLLYAWLGPAWCFTVNAASFLAVIAALAMMRMDDAPGNEEPASVVQEVREGLRLVATHPVIRTIVLLIGVVSFFGFAFATLIPAWAVKILHGNATTNGFLQSARGVGSLGGALIIAALGRINFRGKILSVGMILFPIFTILFALTRWLPLSLVFIALGGLSLILIFNLCNSMVQTLCPDEMRGRVMSIYSLVFFGFVPLGSLVIGAFAQRVGEMEAVLVAGSITAVATIIFFILAPKLRHQP